jgi:hypothetical protein
MELKTRFNDLTVNDLNAFEGKIGYPLPEEYRNFLLKHNGGRPIKPAYFYYQQRLPDGDIMPSSAQIEMFTGLAAHSTGGLEWKVENFRDRIPKNLLPIASESTGSAICISLDGEDKGKVYLWDMGFEEEIDEGSEPDYYNVFWIADNFNDFLNSLSEG